ncbi:MAG: radical SAM protein [Lachnospiraceae bacterium]|nr:radical SAM protein [Lachnospiraceae bacterium]
MVNRDRLEFSNARTDLGKAVPLSTPFVVFLDPCGACNFSCKFCPCNHSDFMSLERHKKMSMQMFEKVLDDLAEFSEQIKVINLYGFGEPLLHPQYIEMVKRIKERKLCREVRCTTNGFLLTPKLNQQLVSAGIDMVRISVEALTEQDYKEICGINIDLKKFISNIKNLYEVSRGTNTKVSVKTLNVALADDAAANQFYDIFEPISDYSYIQDTTQAWSEFDAYVPEGNYEAGNIGDMKDEDKICSFALTNMAIHSNGSVGVCPQDWKFATEYGNVRDCSLKDLWNSNKLKGFRIAHLSGNRRKIPYCRDCDVCVSNDDVRKCADQIIQRLQEGK